MQVSSRSASTRLRASVRVMRTAGTGPVTFTDVERRSSTDNCRWNDEIESAGRFSLRFWRYGGNSTASQMMARMKSTKMVTLRAYLLDSGTVTLHATRVVDDVAIQRHSDGRFTTA